ncbi:RWD domain-containing protein 4-like [Amphiura filiformis]|uniref:RWD domain-containing protein 4-like n=1 Tax=Amphiura filiformis TaxID=82378 RepID=UPI003B215608
MSNCKDDQEEEKEVLLSIYEADECFKQLDDQTYQYRIGDAGHFKSFLLEIKWGDTYPEELPTISLELFFNKHIPSDIKSSISSKVTAEADQWLGSAMTYTLFEFAKENADELMVDQTENVIIQEAPVEDKVEHVQVAKIKEKKVQLTKAQKRRIADRTDFKGERPRGWDWVDIIKVCEL